MPVRTLWGRGGRKKTLRAGFDPGVHRQAVGDHRRRESEGIDLRGDDGCLLRRRQHAARQVSQSRQVRRVRQRQLQLVDEAEEAGVAVCESHTARSLARLQHRGGPEGVRLDQARHGLQRGQHGDQQRRRRDLRFRRRSGGTSASQSVSCRVAVMKAVKPSCRRGSAVRARAVSASCSASSNARSCLRVR